MQVLISLWAASTAAAASAPQSQWSWRRPDIRRLLLQRPGGQEQSGVLLTGERLLGTPHLTKHRHLLTSDNRIFGTGLNVCTATYFLLVFTPHITFLTADVVFTSPVYTSHHICSWYMTIADNEISLTCYFNLLAVYLRLYESLN